MKSKRWPMSVLSSILDTIRVNVKTIGDLQEVSYSGVYILEKILGYSFEEKYEKAEKRWKKWKKAKKIKEIRNLFF